MVHPSLTNIGVAQSMARRPAEAVGNRPKQALAIQRVIYGNEHVVVMRTLGNIGVGLAEQGRFAEARPYFQAEVLDANTRVTCPEHPEVARVDEPGAAHQQLGRRARVAAVLEKAIAIYEKIGEMQHALDVVLPGTSS